MHTLLHRAIDYAGLFPPASLDLPRSLANEAAYRAGQDGWALGSLILPASMLSTFEQSGGSGHNRVSVVLGPEPERDLEQLAGGSRTYDLFECKLTEAGRVAPIMRRLPAGARIFFEVGAASSHPEIFSAIKAAGAFAKVRAGGLVASAIPSAKDLASFMASCARHRLAFKATAGLHHPLRGQYPLTYERDAPRGRMHGFVNVILAAGLVFFGASEQQACAVLEEESADAFSVAADSLSWRDCRLTLEQLSEARRCFFTSFGSCSFTEPVEESRALGWLA